MNSRNIKIFIGVGVLTVLILLLVVFALPKKTTIEERTDVIASDKINSEPNFHLDIDKFDIDMSKDKNNIKYIIGESLIWYRAKAILSDKSEVVVEGKAENTNGEGWFNIEKNQVFGWMDTDFSSLSSEDSQRDLVIIKFFKNTVINGVVSIDNVDIKNVDTDSVKLPMKLTINTITKDIIFDITKYIYMQDEASISGNTKISLSDFNIIIPNLPNILEIEDAIEVGFDINVLKVMD